VLIKNAFATTRAKQAQAYKSVTRDPKAYLYNLSVTHKTLLLFGAQSRYVSAEFAAYVAWSDGFGFASLTDFTGVGVLQMLWLAGRPCIKNFETISLVIMRDGKVLMKL
jgi:hypothetical protein